MSTNDSTTTASGGFSLAAGRGYLMDHGNLEAVRLNYQFYLWREVLGFNIHPSIPRHHGALSAVADVATGTGIWLLDVQKELSSSLSSSSSKNNNNSDHDRSSSSRFDGFDIDLTQVPHAAWLPASTRFHHWDVFTSPPSHLHGVYDLVHVRLLVLVLEGADAARTVLRNLSKLLKPGGYLQWDELDVVNTSIRRPPPPLPPSPSPPEAVNAGEEGVAVAATATPALDELMEKSLAGGRYDWTANLGGIVGGEGFQEVRVESYPDPNALVRPFGEQHLLTMSVFAMGLAKRGLGEAADRFAKLVAEAHREAEGGASLCFPRNVIVARKKKQASE